MEELKEKTEKVKLYVEVGILIASFIAFLMNSISFKTFLIILLSAIFIGVIIMRNWKYPNYKESNKPFVSLCKKFKSIFIVSTIIIAGIALLINLGQHRFPEFQDEFMQYHFTTPKELNELKPKKVNLELKESNKIIKVESTKTIISNEGENYLYNTSKLTEEMIKYSSQNFNSYSLGLIFLLAILLLIFIVADYFIVAISEKKVANGK